ncbi:hypothetical protein C499_18719 [Halogeometricum borinquense DSM 11551]|uniref:Uncharacterized protein n=1 Tax=Halogeometricum borinquense (strain ATCC 700274 / DSM 11551 / JCM 10706 / KCTC 4070 / PR3) TaxID=469382 RepID=E4NNP1_HALBP|nr:hypothetical protein [Halogeometricum borinquense]ADQ67505.1 hypothetical protein Hbor_19380 [Halogeometricum borinquense DSM 11551]ELY23813.1 hypothetical protein C499_18719 [Halogeometricum borinquense DSM 11551]
MEGQPNSPYVFGGDVEDRGPHVLWNEVEETRSYDTEEREVVIVEGEAMSYRAYHRR